MGTSGSPPSRDSYTIGWIAALPTERAAAEEMLDEQHDEPLDFIHPSTDNNSYTWGRIGDHNVVIASLEAGTYGTTPAATTAASMLSSFPQIRFGLLVGIGGGIPGPSRDIRLGDIAISQPTESSGGVVQYDHIRKKAGGEVERKDFLNRPPQVLLSALANLQAKHKRKRYAVPRILKEVEHRNPEMFISEPGDPGYNFQGAENDLLFDPSYFHVDHDCSNCDHTKLLQRKPRANPEIPKVHYGIIASGNTLVKDAGARAELVTHISDSCICYEMEAAGLMNSFPCLVVRGICDYADSHKNDQWQPYAAATAAAFAKELLSYVPARALDRTKKAVEILERLDQYNRLHEVCSNTKAVERELEASKIRDSLSLRDCWIVYNKYMTQRYTDTGSWFLKSEKFSTWKTSPNSFLWLHGLPGCGKSVLSSAIVQDSLENNISQTVLFFYFDFRDPEKNDLDHMIQWLVYQLSKSNGVVRKALFKHIAESKYPKGMLTAKSLLPIFQKGISECSDDIMIVLDALDECTTRKDLLEFLVTMRARKFRNLHLLVTSRKDEDIFSLFCEHEHPHDMVSIDQAPVDGDIRKFVRARLAEHGFRRWKEQTDVQEEIEARLMQKASGMFRWAACQLDVLERCVTVTALQKALASLPKTLDETYDRILRKIPIEQKAKVVKILQFLVYSPHKLSMEEALEMLAVNPSTKEPYLLADDRIVHPVDLQIMLTSLVTVSDNYIYTIERIQGNPVVQRISEPLLSLAHLSVKDYLVSDRIVKSFRDDLQNQAANAAIVEIRVAYLLFVDATMGKDLEVTDPWEDNPNEWVIKKYPFAKNAAQHWMDGAAEAEEQSDVARTLMRRFFIDQGRAFITSRILKAGKLFDTMSRLGAASAYGLVDTAKSLLEKGPLIDTSYCFGYKPLKEAVFNRRDNIIPLLLSHGAGAAIAPHDTPNILAVAARNCNEETFHILDDALPRTNSTWWRYSSTVEAAVNDGRRGFVQRLFAKGHVGYELLLDACIRGRERTVKMLLDHCAQPKTEGYDGISPLFTACEQGFNEIVQMLLGHGADPTDRCRNYPHRAPRTSCICGHARLAICCGYGTRPADGLKGEEEHQSVSFTTMGLCRQ